MTEVRAPADRPRAGAGDPRRALAAARGGRAGRPPAPRLPAAAPRPAHLRRRGPDGPAGQGPRHVLAHRGRRPAARDVVVQRARPVEHDVDAAVAAARVAARAAPQLRAAGVRAAGRVVAASRRRGRHRPDPVGGRAPAGPAPRHDARAGRRPGGNEQQPLAAAPPRLVRPRCRVHRRVACARARTDAPGGGWSR